MDAADVADNNDNVTKVLIMVTDDSTVRVITIKICRKGESTILQYCAYDC